MFRFEHIELLWALLAIPFFVLIFIVSWHQTKAKLKRYGDTALVKALTPDRSRFKPIFKLSILLLAFSAIVVAMANPQIGSKPETVKRQGIELVVALDVSNSMNAEDIRPSRLERAKQSMMKLIDSLQGDRIGIVVFAGEANLYLPITSDYSAAKLLISSVETDLIGTQGTAIGNAIEIATNSFSEKEGVSRAMIIISDGENHEDDAIAAAEAANKKGIKIYTIGMGTPEGAPIPVLDRYGNAQGYHKDQDGQVVMTKLNAAILKQIADKGDGDFAYANNTSLNLNSILNAISGMDKEEFEEHIYTAFDDKFMYFVALGIVLLILEMMISFKKNKYLDALSKFASGEKGGKK